MSGEPIVTVIGNLTDDPELRFTPSGAAVANFTVASTPRVKDGDQWVDGTPMFIRCAVWQAPAENVAESLQRGMRVIVQGALTVRNYEHQGQPRTSLEMRVDEVGPALRFAVAKVQRAGQSGGGQQPRQQSAPAADPWAAPRGNGSPPNPDPWAVPSSNDEPPF